MDIFRILLVERNIFNFMEFWQNERLVPLLPRLLGLSPVRNPSGQLLYHFEEKCSHRDVFTFKLIKPKTTFGIDMIINMIIIM